MREAAPLRAVVQHAPGLVLALHVEARRAHLRVAEAHRLVQVVDAVQEVAVVPPRHPHDRVVAVVRPVLDKALPEEVHVLVGGGAAGAGHRGARRRQPHHHLVGVATVRREDDVAHASVLEHAQPDVAAVQRLDVVLDALQQHAVHGARNATALIQTRELQAQVPALHPRCTASR